MEDTVESYNPHELDRVDIAMHPVACVFAKRTTTVDGKRVKCRPMYYVARIYTMAVIEDGDPHPFIGWTYYALARGDRGRRYHPVCTFTGRLAMNRARMAEDLLNRIASSGCRETDPCMGWRYGLERTLLGWDGQHRGNHVTLDGVDVEVVGGWTRGVDATPKATHNLAWCKMTNLDTRHRHEYVIHRVLVDLESIRQDKRFPDDWWIDTVHHVEQDRTYSEGPQLLIQIVDVESADARRYIANKTGDSKWLTL